MNFFFLSFHIVVGIHIFMTFKAQKPIHFTYSFEYFVLFKLQAFPLKDRSSVQVEFYNVKFTRKKKLDCKMKYGSYF